MTAAPNDATSGATAPRVSSRKRGFFAVELLDNRFPALHGMRFAAIVSVVAFHVTEIFTGTGLKLDPAFVAQSLTLYFGMDLFFVLSGFLIGSILLRSLAKAGSTELRRFYLRRIFRTFPPYYVVLTILAVTTPLSSAQHHHLVWEYVYGTNFLSQDPGQSVMPWAWSLALEEQFYLVIPFIFLALNQLRTARARVVLVSVFFFSALAVRFFLYRRHDGPWFPWELSRAIYFQTYTRFDPLVMGILLAILHDAYGPAIARWLQAPFHRALMALPALAFAWLLSQPLMFGYEWLNVVNLLCWGTLTGLTYLGLIPLAIYGDGWLARAMSWPLFRWLSSLSYGVYLLHPPIIDRIVLPVAHVAQARGWSMLVVWPGALTAAVALSVAGGYVLHVIVEKTALRIRQRLAA